MSKGREVSLSICIPTFNRADFLSEALDSIVANLDEPQNVEIIVSDNASTDTTKEVVETFQKDFSVIRYHRNDVNIGAVDNIRAVISLSRGEFVWIFGDDDIMTNNAISYLLGFLSGNRTVKYVFFSRELKTIDLNPVKAGIQPTGLNKDIIFKNGNDLFCSCDGQMPFILGFLSSTIIDRSIWMNNVGAVQKMMSDNSWGHLMTILRAVKDFKCAILAEVGVYARLNNRPFKANSRIGFDDGIVCFIDAMNLGYSRILCLDTIKAILRIESKSFVVDKACGQREDSILAVLSKQKMSGMIFYSFPWFILSMLPGWILNILWSFHLLIKGDKS